MELANGPVTCPIVCALASRCASSRGGATPANPLCSYRRAAIGCNVATTCSIVDVTFEVTVVVTVGKAASVVNVTELP